MQKPQTTIQGISKQAQKQRNQKNTMDVKAIKTRKIMLTKWLNMPILLILSGIKLTFLTTVDRFTIAGHNTILKPQCKEKSGIIRKLSRWPLVGNASRRQHFLYLEIMI